MNKLNYAARRKSAETLPKAQRLRLAPYHDRRAAAQDRSEAVNPKLYRAPTLALAALETGAAMFIKAVQRRLKVS